MDESVLNDHTDRSGVSLKYLRNIRSDYDDMSKYDLEIDLEYLNDPMIVYEINGMEVGFGFNFLAVPKEDWEKVVREEPCSIRMNQGMVLDTTDPGNCIYYYADYISGSMPIRFGRKQLTAIVREFLEMKL